jgi:hypothetical protein
MNCSVRLPASVSRHGRQTLAKDEHEVRRTASSDHCSARAKRASAEIARCSWRSSAAVVSHALAGTTASRPKGAAHPSAAACGMAGVESLTGCVRHFRPDVRRDRDQTAESHVPTPRPSCLPDGVALDRRKPQPSPARPRRHGRRHAGEQRAAALRAAPSAGSRPRGRPAATARPTRGLMWTLVPASGQRLGAMGSRAESLWFSSLDPLRLADDHCSSRRPLSSASRGGSDTRTGGSPP